MFTLPDTQETNMARKRVLLPPPSPSETVDPTDIKAVKREFARRLQHYATQKGWSQSDLARAAAKFMPDKKFNRDNISLYMRAEQLPGPVRLKAMLDALDLKQEDLLPKGASGFPMDDKAPPLAMKPLSPGVVMLHVNMAMDQDLALKILAMLAKAGVAGAKE